MQTDLAKVPRLREDFDDVRSILTLVYYSRPSNGAFNEEVEETRKAKCFPRILGPRLNLDAPLFARGVKSETHLS